MFGTYFNLFYFLIGYFIVKAESSCITQGGWCAFDVSCCSGFTCNKFYSSPYGGKCTLTLSGQTYCYSDSDCNETNQNVFTCVKLPQANSGICKMNTGGFDLGDPCTSDSQCKRYGSENILFCDTTQFPTPTCQQAFYQNFTCNRHAQCLSSYCNANGLCSISPQYPLDHLCSDNYDCASLICLGAHTRTVFNNNSNQVSGTCGGSNLPPGAYCEETDQCSSIKMRTVSCSGGKCVAKLSPGAIVLIVFGCLAFIVCVVACFVYVSNQHSSPYRLFSWN